MVGVALTPLLWLSAPACWHRSLTASSPLSGNLYPGVGMFSYLFSGKPSWTGLCQPVTGTPSGNVVNKTPVVCTQSTNHETAAPLKCEMFAKWAKLNQRATKRSGNETSSRHSWYWFWTWICGQPGYVASCAISSGKDPFWYIFFFLNGVILLISNSYFFSY